MPELQARARWIFQRLKRLYPDAHCELDYQNPFQLLVATILSAQCTDKAVNQATPELFRRYGDAAALAKAPLPSLEACLRRLGLFRSKARNIKATARMLVERFSGQVPQSREELVLLPGVGRKTANVVLSNAFGLPGLPVDTHVLRVGRRLGLFRSQDPVLVEERLGRLLPPKDWGLLSHLLIWHGRRVCAARKPLCEACALRRRCPSAPKAGLKSQELGLPA